MTTFERSALYFLLGFVLMGEISFTLLRHRVEALESSVACECRGECCEAHAPEKAQ